MKWRYIGSDTKAGMNLCGLLRQRLTSRLLFCLAIVLLAGLSGWLVSEWPPLQRVELWLVDQRLNQYQHPEPLTKIVLILIDEQSKSMLEQGRYPLSPKHYIAVMSKLRDSKVVAFSPVLASEIDSYWHARLSQITALTSQIIHAMRMSIPAQYQATPYDPSDWEEIPEQHALPKTSGKKEQCYAAAPEVKLPFGELLAVTPGLGHVTFRPDSDKIIRKVPLVIKYNKQYYPALSLVAACRYLGVPLNDLEIKFGKHIAIKHSKKEGGTIKIPIDDKGVNSVCQVVLPQF